MTEWTQTEAEARAATAGFLWCPAFPFHAHTWRLAAWLCRRSDEQRAVHRAKLEAQGRLPK